MIVQEVKKLGLREVVGVKEMGERKEMLAVVLQVGNMGEGRGLYW